MRISLRRQIFFWYALVIPLIIVGLAFTAQTVLVDGLAEAVDRRLEERTEVVASAIVSSPDLTQRGYEDLVEYLTEQRLPYVPAVLRISDPRLNIMVLFGDIPDPMLPIMDRQLLLPETPDGRFETIRMRGLETLRLYTVPVYNPTTGEMIALVQTGDSLAPVMLARQQLWRYALSVGVGGSIIALLVGFFILWRGFRPLEKILNRVRDIGSRNLAVRFPEESRPQELQALADTLNSMLERLDAEFKTRERFIATVSHDLRTPLTVIQGQIDVLLMQRGLGKEARQRLEMMAGEARRLTRMTNNLLLSAQLESIPAFIPGSVDLSELLKEVAREARVLAPNLKFHTAIPEIAVVPGDYDLLKQTVLNVVDNALKFTPEGGSVSMSLICDKEYAVIEVSDTGPGISQEMLARIGEPFFKADTAMKAGRSSTGLGLAIVKQIMSLHGGELKIQSPEGGGTMVTMLLPLHHENRNVDE